MESIDISQWREIFDHGSYFLSSDGVSDTLDLSLVNQLPCQIDYFFIRTSGSSGRPKWVVHPKKNILRHACLVNTHLGIKGDDVFGLMLPAYHVGGLGVVARAIEAEADLVTYDGKWSAFAGVDFLINHMVSVVSLVPTQLMDLIRESIQCPVSLRIVIIGGGRLDPMLREKAFQLGWPVYESYGMTETGSQIANGDFDDGFLRLIDGWQVKVGNGGALMVKGECVMQGYITEENGVYSYSDPRENGWFQTCDRVEILDSEQGIGLKFIGRSDQQVKILGELVDVLMLENQLASYVNSDVYLIVINDGRRGAKLFPVTTERETAKMIDNADWRGLEKLEKALVINELPFNEMGKLQRSKLTEEVESIVFLAD